MKTLPLAIVVLALSSPPASARSIVWNFEGTFTFVSTEYQALGLYAGDALSGTVQINPKAKDAYSDNPFYDQYEVSKFTVCVPALATCTTFAGPRDSHVMTVLNNAEEDYLEIYGRDVPLSSVAQPNRIFYLNGSLPITIFTSAVMPLIPPPVSAFHYFNFAYFDLAITAGSSATGTITAISPR